MFTLLFKYNLVGIILLATQLEIVLQVTHVDFPLLVDSGNFALLVRLTLFF